MRFYSILELFSIYFAIFLVFGLFGSFALNPGCRCIRFTSTYGKEVGLFTSPDYPHSYPSGVRCLLYAFEAPRDYIVHLTLNYVQLPGPKSQARASQGCLGGDYLKLFLHLDTDGVNELTPWNNLICGQSSNQTFYSASRNLIVQFHSSDHQNFSNSQIIYGFMGHFRFLNSSQFESNGRLIPGSKCDYQFISANYTSAQGRFFSPQYPSSYPNNIKCTYKFHASLHERIKIVFNSISLQEGFYSCLNKTDVIRVMDGPSSNSPVISLICNAAREQEIISTGPYLNIEFIANSEVPGQGFRATYYFIKVQLDQYNFDPKTAINLYQDVQLTSPEFQQSNFGQDGLPQASTLGLVPQCNQVITSDSGKNGSFTSPNYPHPYSAKTHCRFDFVGHGKERIQIQFLDFNLYQHSSENDVSKFPGRGKECARSDILSMFVHSEGSLVKIDDFCGSVGPPTLMSITHRLTLELNAPFSSRSVRGFHALYYFVEDFGIRGGGTQLSDYPCAFIFNSSESLNGSLSSPNYPGIYPRNAECHYFFYGRSNEHVELYFKDFQISGKKPCGNSDHDSLELSNGMQPDSKFDLICGSIKDLSVKSDRNFFRLTFKSNGWTDGNGFISEYYFRDKVSQHFKKNNIVRSNAHRLSSILYISRSRQMVLLILTTAIFYIIV